MSGVGGTSSFRNGAGAGLPIAPERWSRTGLTVTAATTRKRNSRDRIRFRSRISNLRKDEGPSFHPSSLILHPFALVPSATGAAGEVSLSSFILHPFARGEPSGSPEL